MTFPDPQRDAFYERDGDALVSQPWTRGPWDERFQHGGPPSALMLRAMEAHAATLGDYATARLAVELVRPVPIEPLHVTTDVSRDGRSVKTLHASLRTEKQEVGRADATFIQRVALELPPPLHQAAALTPPEDLEPFTFSFFQHDGAYHHAMELRVIRGEWGQGPIAVWMRQRIPLVTGEFPTGFQRVVTCADACGGICPPLPFGSFTFLNPDLTVYLHREPGDEWVGLDVESAAQSSGIGLAASVLHDRSGPIGRAALSLVVRPVQAQPAQT